MNIKNDTKVFFNDMMDLQRHNDRFIKEHWKGYVVYNAVLGLTVAGIGICGFKVNEEAEKKIKNIKAKKKDK